MVMSAFDRITENLDQKLDSKIRSTLQILFDEVTTKDSQNGSLKDRIASLQDRLQLQERYSSKEFQIFENVLIVDKKRILWNNKCVSSFTNTWIFQQIHLMLKLVI